MPTCYFLPGFASCGARTEVTRQTVSYLFSCAISAPRFAAAASTAAPKPSDVLCFSMAASSGRGRSSRRVTTILAQFFLGESFVSVAPRGAKNSLRGQCQRYFGRGQVPGFLATLRERELRSPNKQKLARCRTTRSPHRFALPALLTARPTGTEDFHGEFLDIVGCRSGTRAPARWPRDRSREGVLVIALGDSSVGDSTPCFLDSELRAAREHYQLVRRVAANFFSKPAKRLSVLRRRTGRLPP